MLQLLAIGVLINASASLPASLLHAAGRPDVTAKLHMIEFPLYIPLVCWLIRAFGIEGAASAWVLRVTLDTALLFWMAGRALANPRPIAQRMGQQGREAVLRDYSLSALAPLLARILRLCS